MSNGSTVGVFLLSLCVWIFIIRWITAASRRGKGVILRKSSGTTGTTPGTGPDPMSSSGGMPGTSRAAGSSSDPGYYTGYFDDGPAHDAGSTHGGGHGHDSAPAHGGHADTGGHFDPGHHSH
jgi:hypothetical protein